MSDLKTAYENYYNDPSQESADKLLNEVKNFDFDEDLKHLQELAENNPLFDEHVFTAQEIGNKTEISEVAMLGFATSSLTTNGSTNGPTAYAFGPNYNYWRENVTKELRNPEGVQNEINLETHKGSLVDSIERSEGPVWLSGRPTDFIFPTTDPKLADYLRANSDKIKYLTTYDTEPLMRKSIYHNDQMIDWRSGLNFHTCRFGNKHVLPTFAFLEGNKVRNLLNMHPSSVVEMSDTFNMKGFFKCPCGSTACDLEFLPHYKKAIRNKHEEPFYMPELMNELDGSYINLQFLQENTGGKVWIYVTPNEVPQSDYDHIRDVLSSKGLDSELLMNRYFMVGRKMIHFWQAQRSKVKELCGKLM
jgi:hypothetical protein